MIRTHVGDRPPCYAAYKLDGCRCWDCSRAMSEYDRQRHRDNAQGRPRLVPAAPVREHVRRLSVQGMGWKRVAAVAGVSTGGMSKLLFGVQAQGRAPSRTVRAATAEKILAVTYQPAPSALVDAGPTMRRLQSLIADGWPKSTIATRLGTVRNALQITAPNGLVLARTADAVAALYDELESTPGPSTRARRYGAAHSWPRPIDWDDIDTGVLFDDGRTGRSEARDEDIAWLRGQGCSPAEVADRLGVSEDYVRDLLAGTKGRRRTWPDREAS